MPDDHGAQVGVVVVLSGKSGAPIATSLLTRDGWRIWGPARPKLRDALDEASRRALLQFGERT